MTAYVQGHAHPDEQPADRPDDWSYDGVPFATFPDLAAIDEMRNFPDYLAHAVPDEAAFLDRAAMSAVLMVDSFGSPPPGVRDPDARTLLVFVRSNGVDADTGHALIEALGAHPGGGSRPHRWSTALETDPGLSPVGASGRPFSGLLEVWFDAGVDATRVAGVLAAAPASVPVEVFCLVVRENVVVPAGARAPETVRVLR